MLSCKDNTLQLKLAWWKDEVTPGCVRGDRDMEAPTYIDAINAQIEESGRKALSIIMARNYWQIQYLK